MSTIKVLVTQIDEIKPHTNADSLEIAIVGGWQACVRKGAHRAGDKIVYFEQGTVLPENAADALGVKSYLSSKTDIDGNKVLVVHRVKLRGESSFGLVIEAPPGFEIGADVAEKYGASKFVPPLKNTCGDAMENHYRFPQYTDIENMRSYPNVFKDGEEVVATEKVHGTNVRCGFVVEGGKPVMMAGSKTMRRKPVDDKAGLQSTYWFPMSLPSVQSLLKEALSVTGVEQAALYGEVFGRGVQDYQYGCKALSFVAFDLMVNGKFMDYEGFKTACLVNGVPMAPPLYRGPFSLDKIKEISCGPSAVGGDHGREGVVVKPVEERQDPGIGRVILKYVGDDYLFRRGNERDTTDA